MLRYPDFPTKKYPEKSQVQNLKHVTYIRTQNMKLQPCGPRKRLRKVLPKLYAHAHAESGRRKCAFPRAHAHIRWFHETITPVHLTFRRRGRGTTILAIVYAIINIRRVFSHAATSVHITAKIRTNVLSAKNPYYTDKIRHCGSTAYMYLAMCSVYKLS